jgi:hypothetical protein
MMHAYIQCYDVYGPMRAYDVHIPTVLCIRSYESYDIQVFTVLCIRSYESL